MVQPLPNLLKGQSMNTIKIWVSEYSMKHVDLSDLNKSENKDFFLFSNSDMSDIGYSLIGMGEVECSFFSRAEIQNNAVEALKTQVQKIKAEAEKEVTKLNEKIQQLLAITNEVWHERLQKATGSTGRVSVHAC